MSRDPGFPGGSAKQKSLHRDEVEPQINTKAPRLVIVYGHGTHSMGHCPNLINEMMMLTGVFSLLHPVADPLLCQVSPDHQFPVPLSDNCLGKDKCMWQSWLKGADVCVAKD